MEIQQNSENNLTENKEPGFKPESTSEIINDLTPRTENKPSSLLGFLKSNARRLAPLALLATAIGGGAKMYSSHEGNQYNGVDAGQETITWQLRAQDRLANVETNLTPGEDFYKEGHLVVRDEKGNIIQKEGYIPVTNFPAEKHSNGEKTTVIGEIPIGTKVNSVLIQAGRDSDGSLKDRYAIFDCKDIHGEVKDPHEDKVIQLDEHTICVVPWSNVTSN